MAQIEVGPHEPEDDTGEIGEPDLPEDEVDVSDIPDVPDYVPAEGDDVDGADPDTEEALG
jgi:hypothetical protein